MLRAAKEHAINLRASWVVGDSVTDIQAGKRAGCRTTLIQNTVIRPVGTEHPDLRARNLRDAVKLILAMEG